MTHLHWLLSDRTVFSITKQITHKMFSKSVVTAFALLTALAFPGLICWADDSALMEVAKTSLPSMESRQDPCQDFYAFACSRNIKWWDGVNPMFKLLNELADEKPAKSMTENMLKRAWHVCMQENSSNATKIWAKISTKFFDQFGGMPALVGQGWQQSTVKSSQTFWRMIGKLLSETIDSFFIIDALTVDDPNVRNVFGVKPPKLLVSRQLLLKHELRHMVEESKARMLQGFSGAYLDKQYLKRSIDDVFEFERRLAQQIFPDVERNINNTFTLNSLSNACPSINWAAFFDGYGILELLLESERKSNNSFSLIVPDLNYVGFLNTIFEGQQQQWATNQTVFNLIGAKISSMNNHFFTSVTSKMDNETRGRDSSASLGNCFTKMIEVMPFAIGYSYVKIIENRDDVIDDVKQLTTFIFEAFAEMLNSTSWATAETKRNAQAKLSEMKLNLGWPTQLYGDFKNTTTLDAFHKEYEKFSSRQDLDWFDAFYELVKCKRRTDLNDFLKIDFEGSPLTSDAFYNGMSNNVTVPLAMLQFPHYQINFPQSYKFGAIGFIIGHEIAHGFDTQGIQFGANANISNCTQDQDTCSLMDKMSLKEFETKAKCVENLYSNKCCPIAQGLVRCANGTQTLNENIADITGQHVAYNAYKKKYVQQYRNGIEEKPILGLEQYSHYQLFWISSAQFFCTPTPVANEAIIDQILTDPHSPNACRVNQVYQNLPDFGRDFNCPIGSPMRPLEKEQCKVWT